MNYLLILLLQAVLFFFGLLLGSVGLAYYRIRHKKEFSRGPSSMLVATKRIYVDDVNSQLQANRAGVLCTVRLTWDGGGLTFDAAQDVALRFKKGENIDIEIHLPVEN